MTAALQTLCAEVPNVTRYFCSTCINQKTGLTCCYPTDGIIEQRRYWQQRYGLACKACLDRNGVCDRGSPCNCCKLLNWLCEYYLGTGKENDAHKYLGQDDDASAPSGVPGYFQDGAGCHSIEFHDSRHSVRTKKHDEPSHPPKKRARRTGRFTVAANLPESVIDTQVGTQADEDDPANDYLVSDEEDPATDAGYLSVRQKPVRQKPVRQKPQKAQPPVQSAHHTHVDEVMMACPANYFLPDDVLCSKRFRAPTSTDLLLEINKHTGVTHPLTQAARPKNSCPCWQLLKDHQVRIYDIRQFCLQSGCAAFFIKSDSDRQEYSGHTSWSPGNHYRMTTWLPGHSSPKWQPGTSINVFSLQR